jgi:hypothetical protein
MTFNHWNILQNVNIKDAFDEFRKNFYVYKTKQNNLNGKSEIILFC